MRYSINFDKVINQLVPHFFGGRKLILYLQALCKPLQILNNEFVIYAGETYTDAMMTSQKIKFEWYLNKKLSKYFLHGGSISVVTELKKGNPIYMEGNGSQAKGNLTLHLQSEGKNNVALRFEDEASSSDGDTQKQHSFKVFTPEINTHIINQEDYLAILHNLIEKYRLADKTYEIIFNS